MPRARYSEKQADRIKKMLTPGRVFILRISEKPEPTEAYAIVTGRRGENFDYSFLDAPGSNEAHVDRIYPRILEIEEVRPDHLRKINSGYKMGRDGKWISPEEQKKEAEKDFRRAMAYQPAEKPREILLRKDLRPF